MFKIITSQRWAEKLSKSAAITYGYVERVFTHEGETPQTGGGAIPPPPHKLDIRLQNPGVSQTKVRGTDTVDLPEGSTFNFGVTCIDTAGGNENTQKPAVIGWTHWEGVWRS